MKRIMGTLPASRNKADVACGSLLPLFSATKSSCLDKCTAHTQTGCERANQQKEKARVVAKSDTGLVMPLDACLISRFPQAEQERGLKVVPAAKVVLVVGVANSATLLTETVYSRTAAEQEPLVGKQVLPARRLALAAHRQAVGLRKLGADSNRDTRRDSHSNTAAGRPDQLLCRSGFQCRFALLLPAPTTMKGSRWPKTHTGTTLFLLA